MNIDNIWSIWGGTLNFSPIGLVLWTLVVTHITIQTVTVYLHRTVAHRGLLLHPVVSHPFRFWNWLTTGMRVKEWVAIHRKHHAKVDTFDDPHTPIFFGLSTFFNIVIWVFFLGVYKYVKESHNNETIEGYGHKTPDDWIEKNLYTPHNLLGVGVILGILNILLFGLPGLLVWGVQALWIPTLAAGVINGFGHWFGYKNYKRDDPKYPNVAFSTNIVPVGILIGGEELHNNHHADAVSPFFAHKWWEFDLGSVTVRLLCLARLAKLAKPLVAKNGFEKTYYKIFGLSA